MTDADGQSDAPREPFAPDLIDRVVRLLCNVVDRSSIVSACIDSLGIAPADADAAIDAAKAKLTRAADWHRDEELGRSIRRLNECYHRAVRDKDNRTALAAQRELNKLLDLYPAFGPPGAEQGAGSAEPAAGSADASPESRVPSGDAPQERRRIESAELADLVGAVEAHLDPLGLSDDERDTDADVVRLAGAEIARLREEVASPQRKPRKRSRKKKGKKAGGRKASGKTCLPHPPGLARRQGQAQRTQGEQR